MKTSLFPRSTQTRAFICIFAALALPTVSAVSELTITRDDARAAIEIHDGPIPVLRFNHGSTQPPPGADPALQRGDYIHPLYGLDGEILTDDYPQDHPHHRAVNWSWATLDWKGEQRDLFAVRGIWARPISCDARLEGSNALITAESCWKWDDQTPVIAERAIIRIHPKENEARAIDIQIRLTALVDQLQYCGRLDAGYSGFNVRMAPAQGQTILFQADPETANPRRAWADYTALFSTNPSGLAILQHPANPGYPNEWRQYPNLNYFQPIYPGGKLIPLPQQTPTTLNYRLYIHRGAAVPSTLHSAWDAFAATTP